ncbi:TFIIB-type zinc ribbon-containing protein [Microbulbifer sp. JMSA002]|uniref:TFIIB-type zinc ribbon-containing protein n=1 Tax=Microbulbifer sp. JMSA002 TaxID=3243368 RepID=UPI004039E6B2
MKRCTSCKKGVLKPVVIEQLFRAHTCSSCGGNWILVEDYLTWKRKNPEYQFSDNIAVLNEIVAEDTKKAILCPVTGMIMQKLKITAGSEHRLDYSPTVGGIWLDKGEWELLRAEGLAASLNSLVTHEWQKKVRDTRAQETFSEVYRSRFGEELYDKVKEIREWLHSQEKKADILAYLTAEDPYSAER